MNRTLVTILVVALLVRLPGLWQPFAGDEIDTVSPARSFALVGDFRVFDTQSGPWHNFTHPPVRTLLYAGWAALFGFSDAIIRLLGMAMGIAFVAVVFYIGKTAYSEKAGLIAAAFAAVSRYSIWFSNSVSVDTGHFLFTTSAAFLFYLIYVKRGDGRNLYISLAFCTISMLTKFTALVIFVPIAAASYLYGKKKTGAAFVCVTVAATAIVMFFASVAFDNPAMFTGPLDAVGFSAGGGLRLLAGDYMYDKAFKAATISWQMTSFFAVLLTASLLAVRKRDRDSLILGSWLVFGFLAVFIPYGQDAQRYFGVALAPAFLLAARYTEGVKFDGREFYAFASLALAAAVALNLNDLMGYYEPAYLGLFYALALLPLLTKYRKQLLVAGFVAMSLYFAFSGAGNLYLVSGTVSEMSGDVRDLGYNYRELWTSKEIAYYVTPADRPAYVNHIDTLDMLKPENLARNNITYVAFFSTPNEAFIKSTASLCKEPRLYSKYGHTIGFVCEIDRSRL